LEEIKTHRSAYSLLLHDRHIDDIFFTYNESKAMLEKILHGANHWHPNMKLVGAIGTCVTLLDVRIENSHGQISTSVYHKKSTEPYIIPFKSDHPRHVFRNIVRGALVRAATYSTTLNAFNAERRHTRLVLLSNG
jgi:hypothetical protein